MYFFKKILTCLFFCLTVTLLCQAQKNKIDNKFKIEYQVTEEETPISIVNCGKYGALTYYVSSNIGHDSLVWTVTQLDVNFEKVIEFNITLPGDIYYNGSAVNDSMIYTALTTSNKKSKANIVVVEYNMMSAKCSYAAYISDSFERFTEIDAVKRIAIVAYRTKNNTGRVLSANFNNGEVKDIISVDETDNSFKRFDVMNIVINRSNTGFYIFTIKNMPKLNSQTLTVESYTNGVKSTFYTKDFNDSITFVSASPLYSTTGQIQSIVGSYYKGELRHIRGDYNFGNKSTGVYSFNLQSDQLNIYPAAKTSQDIYFIWNDPIEFDSVNSIKSRGYLFSGEAFFPVYRTVTDIDYDFWGRPYSVQRIELNGFSTFTGLNYIFLPDGNLVWSGLSYFENVVSLKPLKRTTTYISEGNIINMAYSFDHIQYSILEPLTKSISSSTYYPEKRYRKDVILKERNTTIEQWYGNYFLTSGYQLIKNNSIANKNKRWVMFLQKTGVTSNL